MFASTLITLRETLEASLVVGIVLAYLQRTKNQRHSFLVWLGVFGGMLVSFVMALVAQRLLGGFTGATEEIYEGVTMFLAAGLLTWMIIWMFQQRRTIRGEIEGKVSRHLANENLLGIFFLVLVSTAREGIETVLFLNAALVHSHAGYQVFGGVVGIVIAIGFSYFLFRGIELIPLRKFFSITSTLLILFAAGLVAHGVHAFQEAGVLPWLTAPLWDTNGLLHEDGVVGDILRSLFGYNGDPSGLELAGYLLYVVGIGTVWRRMQRTA